MSRRAVVGALGLVSTGGAGLLAACGAPAAPTGAGATGPSEPAAKTAAPASIEYWDWAAVWKDLVGQLADSFAGVSAGQGRPVTVQWQVAQDYWTKLQVAIAGDTAPDSWRMNGPNLPSWASQGLVEDITAAVAKDKEAAASLKAMAPGIAGYTKRGGKQWSMPFGQAISGILAYNAEVVQAEGLTPPAELWSAGKWTWPVLQEYAVKLTRRDGSRHGYYVDMGSEVGWLPYVFANGGSMFDAEGKRAALNSPQAREALEYLAAMQVKQQVGPTAEELAQENAQNRFLNGRLAMLPRGSWQIKDLNLLAKEFAWDLVPVPLAPRTRQNGSTNQMASIAMGRSSKQKDAVWAWQKYTGSKAGQDIIARAEYFPARQDSAEQVYYKPELGPPHRPLLRDVLKATQPLPWLDIAGNISGWGPIVNPYIDKLFRGEIGVQDATQQMQDELTAGIARGFK